RRPYTALTPPTLLFSHAHADHRALHSFPTRRSSDLRRRSVSTSGSSGIRPVRRTETKCVRLRHASCDGTWYRSFSGERVEDDRRSEEHTSELQSRGHLVCRLLLEKRKRSRTTLPSPH